jgi:hypothetical protein
MSLTLYDHGMAPSPRRARILLAEKGVAHDTVNVDLTKGEQLGEAFRAVNPLCTVPALQLEDGAVLADNAAIIAYAEARWPEPPLLGRTPLEKARIASWNWRIEFEGLMAIAEALRNGSPAMKDRALPGPVDYAQIPELAARGPGPPAALLRDAGSPARRPRDGGRRRFQPGRHHCRGGGGLRARGARQAGRGAPEPAALARRDGLAPVDVAVGAVGNPAARHFHTPSSPPISV